MDISVVLATFKRSEVLRRTLESFTHLQINGLSWDLWVIDNAGDPDTEAVVKKFSDRLPVNYLIERKPGKNNALNSSLGFVKGALVVFTDDDVISSPDWLSELHEGAKRWLSHKVFGGRIIADWPDGVPFWGDDHPYNQSLFSLHCPSLEERPYGVGDFLPYGPNMAVRREIFDRGYRYNPDIGPKNSTIYRMGSETELLRRLKDDGFVPVFLPKALVKHQIRPEQMTPTGLNRRNFRIGLSDADPDNKPPRQLFCCPPYLWKQFALVQVARLRTAVSGNRIGLFENTCRSWRLRGKIYAQRQYAGAAKTTILQKALEAK